MTVPRGVAYAAFFHNASVIQPHMYILKHLLVDRASAKFMLRQRGPRRFSIRPLPKNLCSQHHMTVPRGGAYAALVHKDSVTQHRVDFLKYLLVDRASSELMFHHARPSTIRILASPIKSIFSAPHDGPLAAAPIQPLSTTPVSSNPA